MPAHCARFDLMDKIEYFDEAFLVRHTFAAWKLRCTAPSAFSTAPLRSVVIQIALCMLHLQQGQDYITENHRKKAILVHAQHTPLFKHICRDYGQLCAALRTRIADLLQVIPAASVDNSSVPMVSECTSDPVAYPVDGGVSAACVNIGLQLQLFHQSAVAFIADYEVHQEIAAPALRRVQSSPAILAAVTLSFATTGTETVTASQVAGAIITHNMWRGPGYTILRRHIAEHYDISAEPAIEHAVADSTIEHFDMSLDDASSSSLFREGS